MDYWLSRLTRRDSDIPLMGAAYSLKAARRQVAICGCQGPPRQTTGRWELEHDGDCRWDRTTITHVYEEYDD